MTDEKKVHVSRLYEISMNIGLSLDLKEMLKRAVDKAYGLLELSGASVLFFSENSGHGVAYRPVYSFPSDLHKQRFFYDSLKCIEPLRRDTETDVLALVLPAAGFVLSEGKKKYYHIFHMPYMGLLVFFTENSPLDEIFVRELVPVAEKLSIACSACLQNLELELVSASTRNINLELSRSENSLRTNLEQIQNAQTEIATSRTHLALILQSLGEGIIVLDDNLEVTMMNVRAMEYLDHVPSTRSEFTIPEIFKKCSADTAEIKSFIFNSDDDDFLDLIVSSERIKDRSLRICKNRIHDLYADISETILLLRDITAEQQAERLKNEFISNLSHELRTPMNAILGISKVLYDKNSGNLNDKQKEGLSIISESGDRLLSLINDLLDLSKIEAGKMEIYPNAFVLNDMLTSVSTFSSALIGDKNLSFEMDVDKDIPEYIISDKKRLEQIIMNLIGNAVKFTETGRISLSIKRLNSELFFICSDTGIGIEVEDIPYIFDRFRQVDGSLSRKYSGTGLGLSLSRELVRLMGGDIVVDSEKGVGTSVHFNIPFREAEKCSDKIISSEKYLSEEEAAHETQSVLIVDDEDSARVTVAMILEGGYKLFFAENGSDAVRLAGKNNIDIILMDIMMPVMDGVKALGILKTLDETRHIPVIALTAHALSGEKEKFIQQGFDGYLAKPVDEKSLKDIIRQHTSRDKEIKLCAR